MLGLKLNHVSKRGHMCVEYCTLTLNFQPIYSTITPLVNATDFIEQKETSYYLSQAPPIDTINRIWLIGLFTSLLHMEAANMETRTQTNRSQETQYTSMCIPPPSSIGRNPYVETCVLQGRTHGHIRSFKVNARFIVTVQIFVSELMHHHKKHHSPCTSIRSDIYIYM